MFLGQMNLTPKTLWAGERAGYLAGQTTDGETGMVSSEFLKSGSGEYLTSRRGEVKIGISVPRDFRRGDNLTQVRHGLKASLVLGSHRGLDDPISLGCVVG